MAKKKVFSFGGALADGLEETISAAHNYSGELRIEAIPIKKIELDPENPRNLLVTMDDLFHRVSESDPHFDKKTEEILSLQSIANSIKDQGIINPIIVYKHGEKYRLVAGERRTLGSILAGKLDIPAKILESKPNELKISILQWIENIERADLSLWERLKNLEKISDAYAASKNISSYQVTVTELSNLIGCSKSHAMNYKAVLHATDDIKQLILDNKIKNLEKAAVIADIKSTTVKHHAIQECLSGANLKKLKVIAEQGDQKVKSTMQGEKRGRQTTAINFGSTKNVNVARLIVDSVLKNNSLAHISSHFQDIKWDDHRAITKSFTLLIQKLEELNV